MKGWNIVWHRRDLRLEDNPALVEAAKSPFIPLFIYDEDEYGLWKLQENTKWWLENSLTELKKSYKSLGISLLFFKGSSETIFEKLHKQFKINGVYWNTCYEPSALKHTNKVQKHLQKLDIPAYSFKGNYLISCSKFLNTSHKPYTVFTPFAKKAFVESYRKPLPIPKMEKNHTYKGESLSLLQYRIKTSLEKYWTPGRKGALQTIANFTPSQYEKNRDTPSTEGTSKLSPYLRFGEVSPYEIWHKFQGHTPFLKQLLWREFGNYFLFHFPYATNSPWKESFSNFNWIDDPKELKAWKEGKTGYPIVDAGMQELLETGWMHNRVRMIVASFLTKDLMVHWLKGAKWFWEHLVDGDLANNTLGWQWVAGSGPDAAPYFRIFNPILQSKKFDPDAKYIKKWLPELRHLDPQECHTPWEKSNSPLKYPKPIIDHKARREQALKSYRKL